MVAGCTPLSWRPVVRWCGSCRAWCGCKGDAGMVNGAVGCLRMRYWRGDVLCYCRDAADAGADVDARTKDGGSLLHGAAGWKEGAGGVDS